MQTEKREAIILIGVGSNIEPEKNLLRGIQLLAQDCQILQISRVWSTPAVGTNGPDFLNAAVLVQSNLSADELKNQVLRPIEAQLGRQRSADKNAPRPLDLDVLVHGKSILDTEIWTQAHIAVPAAELLPALTHPQTGGQLQDYAQQLEKGQAIRKINGIFDRTR